MKSICAATSAAVMFGTLCLSGGLTVMLTAEHAAAQSGANLNTVRPGLGKVKTIELGLNKSVIVELPRDARDVIVSNPDVADAIIRTSRKIFLIGNKVGQTNIFIFGRGGSQIASLDLKIERDVGPLAQLVSKYIPGADIKVEIVNDNVVLTGTVPNAEASRRAVDLANAFLSGGEATTGQFAQTANGSGGQNGGGGDVAINNPDSQRQTSQVINLLKIAGADQVQLRVVVAEVQRGVLKQMGVQLSTSSWQVGNFSLLGSKNLDYAASSILQSANSIGATYSAAGRTAQGLANMLERNNLMRTLAEPNLTAVSGEEATFLAGGEFPVVSDSGELTKLSTGVSLSFVPVVLSPERISIQVLTEVSEVDPTRGLTIADSSNASVPRTVPGINVRRVKSTIELPSGGTMVIAGLLQDSFRQSISGMPYLQNLPILGPLFSSRDYVRNQTELVISVTPYLVRPTAASKVTRPDLNLAPATDAGSVFLSRLNKIYGSKNGAMQGQYHGRVGFIYD